MGQPIRFTARLESEPNGADDQPRTVTLPSDLAEAFATAPDAQAFSDGLAFTHRREYAEWVGGAKKPETRSRRAGEAVTRLRAGRRDPTG